MVIIMGIFMVEDMVRFIVIAIAIVKVTVMVKVMVAVTTNFWRCPKVSKIYHGLLWSCLGS